MASMDNQATIRLPLITFLDVEASGLLQQDSYPIEIGWADTLGNSDSFLIRPFDTWPYWDRHAEALHGNTRSQLLEEGIPVAEAAHRLNEMLGVETVYCDAWEYDGFWLSRLFEAAGVERSFTLADVHQLYGVLGAERTDLLVDIVREIPTPHRAREDAARGRELPAEAEDAQLTVTGGSILLTAGGSFLCKQWDGVLPTLLRRRCATLVGECITDQLESEENSP